MTERGIRMKKITIQIIMFILTFTLAGCSKPMLSIKEIPWEDGEKTLYNWVNRQTGRILGKSTYLIRKIDVSGVEAYRITVDTTIGDIIDKTIVTIRADNLRPISSNKILKKTQGNFNIKADYSANLVNIVTQTPKGQKSLKFRISQDSYDNEEVLFMLRALPLALNYKTSFNDVVITVGYQVKVLIQVVNLEEIKVPAGTFWCYKIELSAAGQRQYIWYSQNKPYYMVKYDNGRTIAELAEAK